MEEEARREDVALEVRRRRGQQEDDLSGEEDGEERVGGGEGEDVRLEVLVVFEGEDGRLGRECVVADEQRAVELDRVALRDVDGRGGKARSGKFQNRAYQFLKCECVVEPAAGRGKHASPPQRNVNEQTQQLQELIDNDTEHRSELDVSQIGKCFQRKYHLTLSEEVINTTATGRS